MNPVSSAAEGAVSATAAVSHDASQDAKPADDAERSSAPPAPTAGRRRRNSQHLLRMRSANVTRRASRSFAPRPLSKRRRAFANELGCERLRPQVLSLMESLAPTPAQDASTATPPGAQVESGTAVSGLVSRRR